MLKGGEEDVKARAAGGGLEKVELAADLAVLGGAVVHHHVHLRPGLDLALPVTESGQRRNHLRRPSGEGGL
eukprot:2009654-Pyramimonas_sp.AAC.1